MNASLVPLTLLVLLQWSGSVAAQSAAPPAPASVGSPSMTLQDTVPHLHQPRPALITGGQPEPDAWSKLAAQGVTTVVNLRPTAEMAGRDEAAEVAAAGLAYHEIPVDGAADITEAKALELWTLLHQSDGTVLVHCVSGNRVGALLAVGAAASGALAPTQALELGRSAGLTRAEPKVRELLALPPQAADAATD